LALSQDAQNHHKDIVVRHSLQDFGANFTIVEHVKGALSKAPFPGVLEGQMPSPFTLS